jgi:hypothetical protein
VLHADDLLAFMVGDRVPDRHVVSGQVKLVRSRKRILGGEGVGQRRDGFIQQMKYGALDGPPQWSRQSLDFLPD